MFFAVTDDPVWVVTELHACETTWPDGYVHVSVQPLSATLDFTVMFAVKPLLHWFTAYPTVQPPDDVGLGEGVADLVGEGVADLVGAGVVGAGVVGDGVGVESRPKKWIAAAALTGRLCPKPEKLFASTGARSPVAPYRVRTWPLAG